MLLQRYCIVYGGLNLIHYATKLHATNCTKAVTKLKQSCNTLVTTMLQFVACNFVACNFVAWWMVGFEAAKLHAAIVARL